jgi:hypothetical protein
MNAIEFDDAINKLFGGISESRAENLKKATGNKPMYKLFIWSGETKVQIEEILNDYYLNGYKLVGFSGNTFVFEFWRFN